MRTTESNFSHTLTNLISAPVHYFLINLQISIQIPLHICSTTLTYIPLSPFLLRFGFTPSVESLTLSLLSLGRLHGADGTAAFCTLSGPIIEVALLHRRALRRGSLEDLVYSAPASTFELISRLLSRPASWSGPGASFSEVGSGRVGCSSGCVVKPRNDGSDSLESVADVLSSSGGVNILATS